VKGWIISPQHPYLNIYSIYDIYIQKYPELMSYLGNICFLCRNRQSRKERKATKVLKRDEDQHSKLSRRQRRQKIGRKERVRVWRIAPAPKRDNGVSGCPTHTCCQPIWGLCPTRPSGTQAISLCSPASVPVAVRRF